MIKSFKKIYKNFIKKIKNFHLNCFSSSTVDVVEENPRIIYNNYISSNTQNNINNNNQTYNKINLNQLENYFGNYINKYDKKYKYKHTNKIDDESKYLNKLENSDNYYLYINNIKTDCSICMSKINPLYHNILKLNCKCKNIYYHTECINQWLLTYPTCPICKEYININIPTSFIKKDYFIIIIINLILSSYNFEEIYNHYCYNYKKSDLFYIYKVLCKYILSKKYKKDIIKNNININFNYKLV